MRLRFLVLAFMIVSPYLRAEQPWTRHTIDDSSQGADGVRLLDVNGDGRQDIATAWEEGGLIRAYLHPGKDRVDKKWPAVTVGEVRSGEDAVFADLDGDGAIDVVSACEGKTRALHFHWAPKNPVDYLKAKTWQTAVVPACQDRQAWMYILPMQIDNVHGIDLIVAGKGKDGEIGWLRYPEDPRNTAAWSYETIHQMAWVMSIQLADMDADGDLDVLYNDRKPPTQGIYWLERKDGQWIRHVITSQAREYMFLANGDLDQDKKMDVVCATRKGGILWMRKEEDRWSTTEIPLPDGVGTGKSVAVGDINRDGQNDLVFSCEHADRDRSGLRWLSYEGSPTDGSWQSHEIAGPKGIKFDRIVLHDIDDDQDLDVVTCEERDQLGVIWYENPL